MRRVKTVKPALRRPKGCFLVPDADVSEAQTLGLIVLAISRVIKEKGITERVGKTKTAKVAFNVAKKLNLPVTRSWYKYGGYVWPQFDLENRLNEHCGRLAPTQEARYVEKLAFGNQRELFNQYILAVEKELPILKEDLSGTLERIYAEDAPKHLQHVYLSHKKMTDRFSKVTEFARSGFPQPVFLPASQEITTFHRRISYFKDRPEVVDLVIETTSLLEDLLITYETNQDDAKKLKEWVEFFEKSLDFYHRRIWILPASIMSIETAEGPREREVKEICEHDLKSSWTLRNKLEELSDEAFEKGVYPSKSDILAVQERLAVHLGPKETEIRDVFAEALRTPGRM